MKKILVIISLFMTVSLHAAYIWTSAVPTEIHVVPNGLVLLGEFDITAVGCATGPKAVFLSNTDPNFDRKVALALTANTSGKKIKVLIADPLETICYQISAMGYVPKVHSYYWQLIN